MVDVLDAVEVGRLAGSRWGRSSWIRSRLPLLSGRPQKARRLPERGHQRLSRRDYSIQEPKLMPFGRGVQKPC